MNTARREAAEPGREAGAVGPPPCDPGRAGDEQQPRPGMPRQHVPGARRAACTSAARARTREAASRSAKKPATASTTTGVSSVAASWMAGEKDELFTRFTLQRFIDGRLEREAMIIG